MSTLRAFLKNTTAFLVGLVSTCVAIHTSLPIPNIPQVREKLQWLAENRKAYDTIFIGSSRVRSGFAPEIFDAEMAARGFSTRTYNAGIDALTFPELAFVFDRVSEQKPRGLKRVIVELNPVRWKIPELEGGTVRAVYWHDLRSTAVACEAALRDRRNPPSWQTTAPIIAEHLSLLFANYANLGRGADFLKFAARPKTKQKPLGVGGSGYYPDFRTLSKQGEAELARKLTALEPWEKRSILDDPVLAREIERLADKIIRRGYQAFFVIAPTVNASKIPTVSGPNAQRVLTFHFDDAARFPELYLPAHRYDLQHLNARGSELFAKLLASLMADDLRHVSPVSHSASVRSHVPLANARRLRIRAEPHARIASDID